jgi:uncharacterized protein YndB with AHSA1/START domain
MTTFNHLVEKGAHAMEPIQHTLNLSASPEVVYRAVATPEGIQGWWCADSDRATRAGDETELRFVKDGKPVTMRFRVDVLEPDQRVAWTCIANANPIWVGSTLSWTIRRRNGGTTLEFSHGGLTAGGPPYDMTVQGWQHFMASLSRYVETGTGQPW